jgi:nucleoside 2-deoxyribosyltransferase
MAAIRTNAGFILHYEEEIKAGRLPASLDDMPHYVDRPTQETLLKLVETTLPRTQEYVDAMQRAADSCPPGSPWVVPSTTETKAQPDETFATFVARTVGLIDPPKTVKPPSPCWLHRAGSSLDCKVCQGAAPNEPPDMRIKPFTVYLCGPITGEDIDWTWRIRAAAFLRARGVEVLSPLRGKLSEKIGNQGLSYDGKLANPEMGNRDFQDVKNCDLVLAHFPYMPPRQSIGSLMEMGMAHALGKTIILCTKLQVFNEHLFCRNFCHIETTLDVALISIVYGPRQEKK